MEVEPLHPWDLTTAEAKEFQLELRDRIRLEPPPGFDPRRVAGADLSISRGSRRGYAALVVLDGASLETLDEASAAADVPLPYIPGYLSFRELPVLALAWEHLSVRPDVVVFDGQGIAHPRRFGLACHGGLLFDVPSIGCAKSILVGRHEPLGEARGSMAELVDNGEVIGMAVRTRDRVRPVYVSSGHRIDLATSVSVVLQMTAGYREPETTRRSHRLVNELRRVAESG